MLRLKARKNKGGVCGFGFCVFCGAKRDYEMYALRTKLLEGTVSDLKAKTSNHESLKWPNSLFISGCPRARRELPTCIWIASRLPHRWAPRARAGVPGDARSLSHLEPLFVGYFPWEEEQSFHPDRWMTGAGRHLGRTHAKRPGHSPTIYYLSHLPLFSFQVRSWWFFLRYIALFETAFMTLWHMTGMCQCLVYPIILIIHLITIQKNILSSC